MKKNNYNFVFLERRRVKTRESDMRKIWRKEKRRKGEKWRGEKIQTLGGLSILFQGGQRQTLSNFSQYIYYRLRVFSCCYCGIYRSRYSPGLGIRSFAHFWWATWANRSWSPIFGERPEHFAHIAHLWWATWAIRSHHSLKKRNERIAHFFK